MCVVCVCGGGTTGAQESLHCIDTESIRFRRDNNTYNGQINGAIGQEIIVEARQIRTTGGQEFDNGVNLGSNGAVTFNDMEEIFLVLLELNV